MNDGPTRLFEDAEALKRANRQGEAVALYRRVLREKPDHLPTLMSLSAVHRANANRGQAARYLRRAVRLRPDDWEVRYQLGYLLLRLSRFTEAEGHLRAAADSALAPGAPTQPAPVDALDTVQGDVAKQQVDRARVGFDGHDAARREETSVIDRVVPRVGANINNNGALR